MFFLYKTKNLYKKESHIVMIELYDFVLGKVDKFIFDEENFLTVERQILYKLKDVKMSFDIKKVN